MSFFKNTVSLLSIMCVVPVAYAATARPSILGGAVGVSATGNVRRMPTMTAVINNSSTVSTGTTNNSSLLNNAECIDAYSACIKGADACGPNFEECTNKVLFHAQMPDCLSTLAQCNASGINDLFGTSAVNALASGATTNSYGEVTDYMYPLDGSVLGQMITAASIANKYDTQTCVKRYSSCLRKDSVCGDDFELCTTPNEFKKQYVFCASTLARCQSAGLMELFGTASANPTPTATSRIGMMIEEGASLAAVNAVSTCYKVTDQCILNACAENPYMCYDGATASEQTIAKNVVDGVVPESDSTIDVEPVKNGVRKHVRGYCAETIGTNKYCFATFLTNGLMPTSSQILNEDNQSEVFDMAYEARMNSAMRSKVQDMINDFDERAKSKCVNTFKTCAMRTCGDGSGAACYSLVFGHETEKSINNESVYGQIKNGCSAIVNTDPNCVYAAQHANAAGLYNYQFSKQDAFTILFPEYQNGTESDPLSIVADLNATLSTSYNEAAVAQMRKECQNVATGCVKSMCGDDYENCYRRRSDIFSTLTNTNDSAFNKSMNKVNGVLDYTIILGMCMDTVKNSAACSEHLAIETAKYKITNEMDKSEWGGASSVRSGWIDAGGGINMEADTTEIQQTDSEGNELCYDKCGAIGICGDMSGRDCGSFDEPAMVSFTTYAQSQAANTLFRDLIYDMEIEAQGQYNAKLTQQMNECMNANSMGGVVGKNDMGSSYLWVKLRNNKIPSDYNMHGIPASSMLASNEIYGSFCRVRVGLHSSDPDIQAVLSRGNSWNYAYFALGDGFTCGSWIPSTELETLATAAAKEAVAEQEKKQKSVRIITTILGGASSAVGGGFMGQKLADNGLDAFNKAGGRTNRQETYCDTLERAKTSYQTAAKHILDRGSVKVNGQCETDNVMSMYAIIQESSRLTPDQCAAVQNLIAEQGISNIALDCDVSDKDTIYSPDSTIDTAAKAVLRSLMANCQCDESEKHKGSNGWTRGGGAALGAIGLGAAGTLATYYITKAAQDANLTAAEQAAYDEFMESVGSKIRCVIGPDEVGSFGQFIPTSFE